MQIKLGPEVRTAHEGDRGQGRGCTWLCDADVDQSRDLKEQGCWNCKDVSFTRSS